MPSHDYTVRIMGVTWNGKAANLGEAVRKAAHIIGIDSTWRGVPMGVKRCVSS